jgi:transcriptional regulator with XRE-family HTH domain
MQMHVLRDLREEKGLTLRAMAELAGVSVATVLRAEQGETVPYGRTMHKFARALGVPVAVLRDCGPVGSPKQGRLPGINGGGAATAA